MMDKIGDDVVCPDLPFAPITVGGRGGKGKQMQALLQLLQVQHTISWFWPDGNRVSNVW